MIRSAGAAALVALAACSAPAPWVWISDDMAATTYMDTSRLTVKNGVADVWLRFDFDTPHLLPDSSSSYQRADIHEQVECAAERVTDRGVVLRDAGGKQVGDGDPSPAPHAFAAHPLGEDIFPILCKRLPEWTR